MSNVIKYHKVVSSLPGTLEANSVYYVRVGAGVDVYVSNDTGIVTAYALNPPSAGTILATELVGLNTAATPSAIVNGDTIIDALGKIQAQLNDTSPVAAATKLATARTISITGDATWTTSFDGSANVTGALTLANSGVTAGTYPKVTVDAKGRVTAGATLVAADIPALDASKITTGTLAAARIPMLNQNTTGSAATLTTARTISITGDATWSTSFNGSANATGALTLADSGVTAGSYTKVTVDAKGRVTAGATLVAADIPALDASKITSGVFPDARLSGTYTGVNITGNAATATKLQTARTISLGGDLTGSVAFDGSANALLNASLPARLGKTAQIITDWDLAVENGYFQGTDALNAPSAGWVIGHVISHGGAGWVTQDVFSFSGDSSADSKAFRRELNNGIWGSWYRLRTTEAEQSALYNNASNLSSGIVPDARLSGTYTGVNITGNAATATKLATARTIALTGDVTGSGSFDGTGNLTITATIGDDSHNHTISNVTGLQAALDGKQAALGFTPVQQGTGAGQSTSIVKIGWSASGLLLQVDATDFANNWPISISKNAATATNLTTARTISLTGDASGSVAFDGSANVSIAVTVTDDSHNHTISNVTGLQAALDAKAPLASPSFTGATSMTGGAHAPWAELRSNGGTPFLDFSNDASTDFDVRLILSSDDLLELQGGSFKVNGEQYVTGWVRSTGSNGIYWESYGGGWHMTDTTWMRCYGGKPLYVANQIAASGNIIAYYSDERLKENIKPIENALWSVTQLTGVRYNANELAATFGYDRDKKEIGLLAQEVKKVAPEAVELAPFDVSEDPNVSKSGENYLTLKYERLVPLLVEAIKELKAELDELKAELRLREVV